ncbi:unnamed protein product [Mytilus coruscus]|uniref:Uncharacterized protein n=1 Tax=Mytilus coruscus TaxID=42192 RepID=A0A6J8EB03_MYTCO|nr:unnamed protein product [Mytilus coruscus]
MQTDVGGNDHLPKRDFNKDNNPPTRHCAVVQNQQAGFSRRANSAMGNKTGKSSSETKEEEVPRTRNRHPREELEDMVFSSGGRLSLVGKSWETGGEPLVGYGGREKSSGRVSWFLAESDQLKSAHPWEIVVDSAKQSRRGVHLMMELEEQWKHCI